MEINEKLKNHFGGVLFAFVKSVQLRLICKGFASFYCSLKWNSQLFLHYLTEKIGPTRRISQLNSINETLEQRLANTMLITFNSSSPSPEKWMVREGGNRVSRKPQWNIKCVLFHPFYSIRNVFFRFHSRLRVIYFCISPKTNNRVSNSHFFSVNLKQHFRVLVVVIRIISDSIIFARCLLF